MTISLQLCAVTQAAIDDLRANPSHIQNTAEQSQLRWSTYFSCSINYFLAGDAYPNPKRSKPITAALVGFETIECESLESGEFGLIQASDVALVAEALDNVNIAKVSRKVTKADEEELADEEVDDFELLVEEDDPAATFASEVDAMRTFYSTAREQGAGVVIF